MQADYLPLDGWKNQQLYYVHGRSSFGPVLMLADGAHRVVFLGFCAAQQVEKEVAALAKKWHCNIRQDKTLTALLDGVFADKPVPLALVGTAFQQCVWQALLQVKRGATSSYGALARQLGSHPRAVGGAVGANPVSYLVPCHRILAADGKLNGYRWGLSVKQKLLAAEAG